MQIFPLTTKNRIPDPSEILALEFKGEFRRSEICSVSQTIDIDWSIFLGVLRKSGVSSLTKKAVSDGEVRRPSVVVPRAGCDTAHHSRIERRRFKGSQIGFRSDYGTRCRRPAARQSSDMDSPARSGAYAVSLRDTNSVK